MPIVAMTAVSASSSGTPAATSAPKASSRMIRVIGRDVIERLAEVVLDDLVDLLLGAGVAELAQREARVRLLDVGDGLNGRLDPVR